MNRSNIEDISQVLSENEGLLPFEIFDGECSTKMDENPRMKALQKNHWDTYRDLNKVVMSDLCRENKIGLGQICLVDNE